MISQVISTSYNIPGAFCIYVQPFYFNLHQSVTWYFYPERIKSRLKETFHERAAVTVSNLAKRYGEAAVLEGLSLTFEAGAFTAVLGLRDAGNRRCYGSSRALNDPTKDRCRSAAKMSPPGVLPTGAYPWCSRITHFSRI